MNRNLEEDEIERYIEYIYEKNIKKFIYETFYSPLRQANLEKRLFYKKTFGVDELIDKTINSVYKLSI